MFLNLSLYMFGHLAKNNIFVTFKRLNVGQMYGVYDVCVCACVRVLSSRLFLKKLIRGLLEKYPTVFFYANT